MKNFTFSAEHKADNAPSGNYFGEGVHVVQIMQVDFNETPKGQPYMEFTVVDPENDERTGTARMWFTTDAAINYTFSIVKGIFVHNSPEDKKETVRGEIDGLKDLKQFEDACNMLVGKECYYKVEKTGDSYVGTDGKSHPNYNRNVYGYEPPFTGVTVEDEEAAEPAKPGKGGKVTGF